MPNRALNLLIADDDEGDRKLIKRAFKEAVPPYECTETTSIDAALNACEKSTFDCAIVDYRLPGRDGLAGITALHERLPYMAIIMFTGQGDEMVATEAMKRGASDYIPKAQIDAQSIRRICENAIEKLTLRRQVAEQREELENFASVLVHDLKAPLSSILGFTGFIEQSIHQEKPEKTTEYCQRVARAARRMSVLIDTLRGYTRAGAMVVLKPVEMGQVLEDTLANLEFLVQERGARITHDELPTVTGNAPQLVQLLQNLIGNGIKYCEAETPTVHVAASSPDAAVWRFSVKDNGIGIPKESYAQVFQPFKRLHGHGKYEGTGLGLATCVKIVERHGGTIWCESEEGLGTTFFFTLTGTEGKMARL
jgi:signal transduction histidine kinase